MNVGSVRNKRLILLIVAVLLIVISVCTYVISVSGTEFFKTTHLSRDLQSSDRDSLRIADMFMRSRLLSEFGELPLDMVAPTPIPAGDHALSSWQRIGEEWLGKLRYVSDETLVDLAEQYATYRTMQSPFFVD